MTFQQRLKQQARDLVAELTRLRGDDSPPFPAAAFASLLGNVRVSSADLGKRDALLLTLGGRHLVKVNEQHHPIRQNFSLAHELGHILLNQARAGPTPPLDFRGVTHQMKERLCDMVAVELLMPEAIFRKHLGVHGLSIDSLVPLAEKFRTSREATARRMAEVSQEPCLVVCWKWGRRRNEYMLRAARSTTGVDPKFGKETAVTRWSGVPTTSSVYAAFKDVDGGKSVSSWEQLVLGGRERKVYVESQGFGPRSEDKRYVISLVFLDTREKGAR